MRRWIPHPVLAFNLLVAWLLLQQSLSPGNIILGAALGIWLSRLLHKLQPPTVRIRRFPLMLRLACRVLADIIQSNIAIARLILSQRQDFTSGFVAIPLEVTTPHALAVLACIITATPGTIWVSHDSRRQRLIIHVADLVDEQDWIDSIKQNYERPLMEIFR